ncbi:hypothetical protein COT42_05365 [Candidatus Saganbacteria bacterium CG08_land_8_20_14_0_20_45_16]|uniref:Uncharacterized protein n=1 Tax=Candidatus Saganbacteria bacterium CG08_land_8_20_14_0_20_45_16 TaxID=2014293 RepID=A0A2H0XWZ0_UNCSA|nr:MAG: hypothetical protein COT42_05365 [Candidatus Saganbacteria bacterium CG08_land_8_20_14_0_20_45_16]
MKRARNIFADKATLVLRKMMSNPARRWVTRDFSEVSLGMAQGVLEAMAKLGFIERVVKGPRSYSILANKQALIKGWLKAYQFEFNQVETYYSPDKNILAALREYFREKRYALTLHAGANLITSFVRTEQVYLYLELSNWSREILEMRQRLGLKELVSGGNIHLVRPYYKKSVFYNVRAIKGYQVVSNLQLYLDLFNFVPRGQEQAEYLKKEIVATGENFYGS